VVKRTRSISAAEPVIGGGAYGMERRYRWTSDAQYVAISALATAIPSSNQSGSERTIEMIQRAIQTIEMASQVQATAGSHRLEASFVCRSSTRRV
jgi:hypothetical protein